MLQVTREQCLFAESSLGSLDSFNWAVLKVSYSTSVFDVVHTNTAALVCDVKNLHVCLLLL